MSEQGGTLRRRPGDGLLESLVRLAHRLGGWRAPTLALAYIAAYVLLDRISYIDALRGLDVTPWQPEAGLALAILVTAGLSFTPVAVAAALVSSQIVPDHMVPLVPAFLGAMCIGGSYAAAAAVLRHVAELDGRLHRSRDIVRLILAAIPSAGLATGGYVTIYAAFGLFAWPDVPMVFLQLWIGHAIGAIVMAPLFLVTINDPPDLRDILGRGRAWAVLELVAQWGSIAVALTVFFMLRQNRVELFYPLFLPLVWIAARRGLPGAVWAVLTIQAGLIAVLQAEESSVATMRTFQLLMFAVATTGMMLGAAVSERQRAARALADSRSHLATILNTAHDGVVMVDASGRVESVNPAIERLFGEPAMALVGRDIRDMVDMPGLPALASAAQSLPDGAGGGHELTAHYADGSTFPIELSVGPFGAPGREHYTLVIRDITARREAETRTRVHQSELAQASRLTLAGEMASALAHELNQPLTAIVAYARGCLRLLRPSDPELLREGVGEVVHQAERAADVIARIREFMRTGMVKPAPVEVGALAKSALALVGAEAEQNGISLRSRIPADLPAVLIDRVHVEQVILNLVRNAMEAMLLSNSSPRTITLEARDVDGQRIEIMVADTGPGLAEEVTSRLFHPFVTTKAEGMGLGLSISHSMIEAHGGQLRLVRNSAAGAAFAFDLPLATRRGDRRAG
ncbi:MAG: PAS domain S-box protein [Alphaproteobacteria bacterium]|nr:PAS domain S-box protein [Alphaproteobacteria bacterium]